MSNFSDFSDEELKIIRMALSKDKENENYYEQRKGILYELDIEQENRNIPEGDRY